MTTDRALREQLLAPLREAQRHPMGWAELGRLLRDQPQVKWALDEMFRKKKLRQ